MPLTLTPSPTAFWLVWRDNGGPPTVRHRTLDAAEAEAKRLAEHCPGERFFVLEALVAVTKPPTVVVERLTGGSGEIPF